MSNVLITGATGFIGKRLAAELTRQGHKVVVLVRKYSDVFSEDIKQVVVENLDDLVFPSQIDHANESAGVRFQSALDLLPVFENMDVFIHAAAKAHVKSSKGHNPLAEFRKVNVDLTLTLARLAERSGIERFVFLSSIGVNGNTNEVPFKETDLPNPQEDYAISKLEAEQGLQTLFADSKMELVIIRPPLVYGLDAPGNFGSLLKWVEKGVPLPLGAVYNKRSLISLDNLVDFIALCVDRKRSPLAANQVFLVSDGEDVSTTEILRKVAQAYGKRIWLLPMPVWLMRFVAALLGKEGMVNKLVGNLQVDSSKAQNLLGWAPVVTMEQQLSKMVKEKKL